MAGSSNKEDQQLLRDLIDGYADFRVLNRDINEIKERIYSNRKDLAEKFNSIKAEVETNAHKMPPKVVPSGPISHLDISGTEERIRKVGEAIDFRARMHNVATFPIAGYPLTVFGMSMYVGKEALGTKDITGWLLYNPNELFEKASPRDIYEVRKNFDQFWGPTMKNIKDFLESGLPYPLNTPETQELKRKQLSETFGKEYLK